MRNTNRKGGAKPGRTPGRRREEGSRSNTGRRTEHGTSGEERRPGPPRKYAGKPGKPFKRDIDDNSRETPFRRERSDRPYDPESKPRSYRKKEGEHSDDKPFRRERSDRLYDPESKPRSYRKKEGEHSDDRPFRRERTDRPYDPESKPRSYRKKEGERADEKPFRRERSDRPYDPESKPRSYRKKEGEHSDDRPFRRERSDRPYDPESKPRSYRKKEGEHSDDKPFRRERTDRPYDLESKPRSYRKKEGEHSDDRPFRRERSDRPYDTDDRKKSYRNERGDTPLRRSRKPSADGLTRLNKYIANAGICSRREADELIQAGVIKVNGQVVTEMGYKVGPGDKVMYEDQLIRSEKLVYVLLNKPKGYITTVDDPYDRKTVMALVESACKERIYPVGRLDRNTSGLLLLTNDGDLAKKLTHPKHNIRKVYHAELDKALTKADMLTIAGGIELEDGLAQVDEIAYAEGGSKKEIGIELHSGKNRIVRRIFESLGYDVVKLDRVIFAGLTKKDLPRSHWRMLTEKEVNFLKMIR